jgi:hypothetical protein
LLRQHRLNCPVDNGRVEHIRGEGDEEQAEPINFPNFAKLNQSAQRDWGLVHWRWM